MKATDIKYIIIHCSATRSNMSYTALQMDLDHRARGMRSAGYHFYIRRSGVIEPMRPLCEVGAHTRGYNRCSIGVCYEGGLSPTGEPADTRTEAQRAALRRLLYILRDLYPRAVIVGHRDLSPDTNRNGRVEPYEWLKACPSFDARAEYATLR